MAQEVAGALSQASRAIATKHDVVEDAKMGVSQFTPRVLSVGKRMTAGTRHCPPLSQGVVCLPSQIHWLQFHRSLRLHLSASALDCRMCARRLIASPRFDAICEPYLRTCRTLSDKDAAGSARASSDNVFVCCADCGAAYALDWTSSRNELSPVCLPSSCRSISSSTLFHAASRLSCAIPTPHALVGPAHCWRRRVGAWGVL